MTGRVSPPHSLTPEEGGFSDRNVEEHSPSTTTKMGQDDAGTYHNGKLLHFINLIWFLFTYFRCIFYGM